MVVSSSHLAAFPSLGGGWISQLMWDSHLVVNSSPGALRSGSMVSVGPVEGSAVSTRGDLTLLPLLVLPTALGWADPGMSSSTGCPLCRVGVRAANFSAAFLAMVPIGGRPERASIPPNGDVQNAPVIQRAARPCRVRNCLRCAAMGALW